MLLLERPPRRSQQAYCVLVGGRSSSYPFPCSASTYIASFLTDRPTDRPAGAAVPARRSTESLARRQSVFNKKLRCLQPLLGVVRAKEQAGARALEELVRFERKMPVLSRPAPFLLRLRRRLSLLLGFPPGSWLDLYCSRRADSAPWLLRYSFL